MLIPDKVYNLLKWIALIAIPAVVTFLSVLNMSKNNELVITQDKNFGDIYLEMK